jgi:hypothetical protein
MSHRGTHRQVSGDSPIHAKTDVTLGAPPSGFATDVQPIAFDVKKSNLEVSFIETIGGGSQFGDFRGAALIEGRWVDWNGKTVDSPLPI